MGSVDGATPCGHVMRRMTNPRTGVCTQENMLQEDGSEVEAGTCSFNFSVIKRFRVDINPRWMSLSPTEDTLMCCSAAGDVGKLTFANLDDSEPYFELLCSGFHHGAVTDMDVCVGRPLLVSSGVDQTVRVARALATRVPASTQHRRTLHWPAHACTSHEWWCLTAGPVRGIVHT